MHCAPLPVGYLPTSSFGEFDRAIVFSFFIIFYYYYSEYDFLNIIYYYYSEYDFLLGFHVFQYLVWTAIFESGFYSIFILFYLADLFRIPVCPKGFLFWLLIGTEKVGSSHLVRGWYRESPICIIFYFIISRIVISIWQYSNWKHNFLIPLSYLYYSMRWIIRFRIQLCAFSCHSPRALSPRETKFS
jgi:hypothetical protein